MAVDVQLYANHWSRTTDKEKFVKQAEDILRKKGWSQAGGNLFDVIMTILTDEVEPGQKIHMNFLRSDLTMARALELVKAWPTYDMTIKTSHVLSIRATAHERGIVVYLHRDFGTPIPLFHKNKYSIEPIEALGLDIHYKTATVNGETLTDKPVGMFATINYIHRTPDDDYEIVSIENTETRNNNLVVKKPEPTVELTTVEPAVIEPIDNSAAIDALRKYALQEIKAFYPNANKVALALEFAQASGFDNVADFINSGNTFEEGKARIDEYLLQQVSVDPTAADFDYEDSPSAEIAPPAPTPIETPKTPTTPLPVQMTTLTGVCVLDIPKAMDKHLPPQAYKAIPYGTMEGKTDVRFQYVLDRFNEVFGPQGIGWRIAPDPHIGRVVHTVEQRTNAKTGKVTDWHCVAMEAYTFSYAVLVNGALTWVDASTVSDNDDNTDKGYAYRGAWTSLLKQVWRGFGGMNHILKNEYTHEAAQRDMKRRIA